MEQTDTAPARSIAPTRTARQVTNDLDKRLQAMREAAGDLKGIELAIEQAEKHAENVGNRLADEGPPHIVLHYYGAAEGYRSRNIACTPPVMEAIKEAAIRKLAGAVKHLAHSVGEAGGPLDAIIEELEREYPARDVHDDTYHTGTVELRIAPRFAEPLLKGIDHAEGDLTEKEEQNIHNLLREYGRAREVTEDTFAGRCEISGFQTDCLTAIFEVRR